LTKYFLQPVLLDWWLRNTQNSLKLSQSQTNKQAGFGIILHFPQRYFWGIRVPQKYLYVICVSGVYSIANDVTDYPGLFEPFQKDLILKAKLSLNYYQ
jgi:hypothetical protein